MGLDQGPAYFTRSRSGPVRRPRSYSRSPAKLQIGQDHAPNLLLEGLDPTPDLILDPPAKHLKGEDLVPNHHQGHL